MNKPIYTYTHAEYAALEEKLKQAQTTCKALADALDALIIDDDWGLSIRVDLKLAARAKAAIAQYRADSK